MASDSKDTEERGLSVSEVRSLLRRHGGSIHGPNVETVSIPEDRFYEFLTEFAEACKQ